MVKINLLLHLRKQAQFCFFKQSLSEMKSNCFYSLTKFFLVWLFYVVNKILFLFSTFSEFYFQIHLCWYTSIINHGNIWLQTLHVTENFSQERNEDTVLLSLTLLCFTKSLFQHNDFKVETTRMCAVNNENYTLPVFLAEISVLNSTEEKSSHFPMLMDLPLVPKLCIELKQDWKSSAYIVNFFLKKDKKWLCFSYKAITQCWEFGPKSLIQA